MIIRAPFVTRMLVDNGLMFPVGFLCYALVQVLLVRLMLFMISHACRAQLFLAPRPPQFSAVGSVSLMVFPAVFISRFPRPASGLGR